MASREGITYLRTTREKTPVLDGSEERFPIGGSKVLRRSPRDVAAVLAAGITLHEALRAHELLAAEGIPVRVVDLYSVKPIDARDRRGLRARVRRPRSSSSRTTGRRAVSATRSARCSPGGPIRRRSRGSR